MQKIWPFRLWMIMLTAGVCFACGMSDAAPRRHHEKEWTVVVYMAADNNLDLFGVQDIIQMEIAGSSDAVDYVVYLDRVMGSTPEHPVVLWITNDASNLVASPVIREYPEQDSCDPLVLREYLQWALGEFPSRRYGLILWSHGTGWLPQAFGAKKRTFGQDVWAGSEMEIPELAAALEGMHFDFIAFDACSMADAEVVYELRSYTEMIMASQTDILAEGYPYGEIFAVFNAKYYRKTLEILEKIAQSFHDHYASKPFDFQKSASIAVVDLSGIESLAVSLSNFLDEALSMSNADVLINLAENVQRLSLDSRLNNVRFDLFHWIEEVVANFGPLETFPELHDSFQQTIVWQTNTEWFMDLLALENLNGLTVWIPLEMDPVLLEHYTEFGWGATSGMGLLLQD